MMLGLIFVWIALVKADSNPVIMGPARRPP
jgi:hypothetical protein